MILCSRCSRPLALENVDRDAGVAHCEHCGEVSALSDLAAVASAASLTPPPGVALDGQDPVLYWTTLNLSDRELGVFFGSTLLMGLLLGKAGLFAVLCLGGSVALRFVNRSTFHVEGGALVIRHGPVPWSAPAPIPVDRIGGLSVRRRRFAVPRRGGSETFDLVARVRGAEIDLVQNLQNREVAEFLRETLSERARIPIDVQPRS